MPCPESNPCPSASSLVTVMAELLFSESVGKLHLLLRHLVVSRSQDAGGCSAGDVSHAFLHQVELFVVAKNVPPHTHTHTHKHTHTRHSVCVWSGGSNAVE
jgi:hypothetical protein